MARIKGTTVKGGQLNLEFELHDHLTLPHIVTSLATEFRGDKHHAGTLCLMRVLQDLQDPHAPQVEPEIIRATLLMLGDEIEIAGIEVDLKPRDDDPQDCVSFFDFVAKHLFTWRKLDDYEKEFYEVKLDDGEIAKCWPNAGLWNELLFGEDKDTRKSRQWKVGTILARLAPTHPLDEED